MGDMPSFLMDLVGPSLADLLNEEKTIGKKEKPTTNEIHARLKVAREIALALRYLHNRGIVHRDVKLSNMLYGSGGVYLTDFDFARPPREEFWMGGDYFKTPEYASPEQARGEGLSFATDIYSFGICLYELITGQHPFCKGQKYKTKDICLKQIGEMPVQPTEINENVSCSLSRIAMKAMAKNPENRYRRMEHLIADLREELSSFRNN